MANAIGRPAPPGRPRIGNQSRSGSTYSLSRQTPPRSPLAEHSTLPGNEGSIGSDLNAQYGRGSISTTGSTPVLGLITNDLNHAIPESTSATTQEIPYEEFEEYLRNTSREDLVLALKRAKEQMDEMDAKLDVHIDRTEQLQATLQEYASQVENLENDKGGLQFALSHREERIDDLMREQERIENELFLKDQMNERLRKQLDESERAKSEAERRYADQTNTIDKERQYYLDTEKLLQTQKAKAAANLDRIQSNNQQLTRENDRLQSQVAQMQHVSGMKSPVITENNRSGAGEQSSTIEDTISLSALDSEHEANTLNPIAERSSYGKGSRSLAAEQDATELESLKDELAKLQATYTSSKEIMHQMQAELKDFKSMNADLRSQNETFVDLLQEKTMSGELITGSLMLNRQYNTLGGSEMSSEAETSTTETSEAEDDVPDVPRQKNRSSDAHRRKLMAQASREILKAPRNLASELEQSEESEDRREARRRERTRERSEALGDNVEELQKEVIDLRDANQALTLYVTKILDRIIAKEGYEQVLAIDADKKGTLRNKSIRSYNRSGIPESFSNDSTAKQPSDSGSAGGYGGVGGFLGLGRPQGMTSPKSPNTPTPESHSFASRARRTASIDWRSLIPSVGGTSMSPTIPEDETSVVREARKIRSSEEVEDKHDELERERIRENLRSQGIVAPDHQLKSQKRASTSFGMFFQRVIGGNSDVGNEAKESGSIVGKGQRHPAPRMTTFDGGANLDSKKTSSISDADSSMTSEDGGSTSSSPIVRMNMRQRALEQGGSNNLTEAPARRSIIEERKARRSGNLSGNSLSPTISRTSTTGMSDVDSGKSSPVVDTSNGKLPPTADEDNPGWRKAFKRMSLLGSTNPPPNQADTPSNNNTATNS